MLKKKESAGSDIKAFLGKGSEFEGKLSFQGTVRIDGSFRGEIRSEDTLIIGDDAVIKAELMVGKAVISGTVDGNITTSERLELYPPAKVTGSINTPALVVIEGAMFEGTCHMPMAGEKIEKEEEKRPTLLSRLEASGV